MKNKTFEKRKKNMNTCYIAPHKHNHAKKKAVNHPFKGIIYSPILFQTSVEHKKKNI